MRFFKLSKSRRSLQIGFSIIGILAVILIGILVFSRNSFLSEVIVESESSTEDFSSSVKSIDLVMIERFKDPDVALEYSTDFFEKLKALGLSNYPNAQTAFEYMSAEFSKSRGNERSAVINFANYLRIELPELVRNPNKSKLSDNFVYFWRAESTKNWMFTFKSKRSDIAEPITRVSLEVFGKFIENYNESLNNNRENKLSDQIKSIQNTLQPYRNEALIGQVTDLNRRYLDLVRREKSILVEISSKLEKSGRLDLSRDLLRQTDNLSISGQVEDKSILHFLLLMDFDRALTGVSLLKSDGRISNSIEQTWTEELYALNNEINLLRLEQQALQDVFRNVRQTTTKEIADSIISSRKESPRLPPINYGDLLDRGILKQVSSRPANSLILIFFTSIVGIIFSFFVVKFAVSALRKNDL